jgi:hypothetical protein
MKPDRTEQGLTPRAAGPTLVDRLMLYISKSRYVDGLWIGAYEDKEKGKQILTRLEAALALIKRYDRVRYDRIIRDLRRIWVVLLPGNIANFAYQLETCQIDTRYFIADTTTLEMIASTIVHEATHARLWRFGYEQAIRSRIEAICIRREIAFAAKLPNGEQVRDSAEKRLTFSASQDIWTNAAFRDRRNEGTIEAMRYVGAPEWLIRAGFKLRSGVAYIRWGIRRLWRPRPSSLP